MDDPFVCAYSDISALLPGADQLNGLFARHMLYGHLQHTKGLPVSFNGFFPVVRAIIGRILFCQLFDSGQLFNVAFQDPYGAERMTLRK